MSHKCEYLYETINELLKNTDKCCVVFLNEAIEADDLGKYISALANQATLHSKQHAYILWGYDPQCKVLIGTDFLPSTKDVFPYLSANVNFSIEKLSYNEKDIVLLEVQCAVETTIQYKGDEYILNNDRPEKLNKFQDREKTIWKHLITPIAFENQTAMENVPLEHVYEYLDCIKLFEMLNISQPQSTMGTINTLIALRFIKEQNNGKYTITNLGALLLAKRLSIFSSVQFKAVRVLTYEGNDVTQAAKEQIGGKGYLVGFEGLMAYIMKSLPTHEKMDGALRKHISSYPMLSIRELVANALIHQDFSIPGCPIISIFPNRIEITNPGTPLISPERFIDTPPCSRNEALASAMRRVGICEERGSGYDKVISYIEQYNLPAPEVTVYENHTKVVLSEKKGFDTLTKNERILACYNHTCLNYVQGKITNNTSLRIRFQLEENERYKVSRVFSDAADLVKAKEGTGPKNREYIPFWAK